MTAQGFNLANALVLARADAGDINAEVVSANGWTNLSNVCKGRITINETRETTRLPSLQNNQKGKVLPGEGAGTADGQFIRTDGEAIDAAAFFDAIFRTQGSRMQYVIQPDKGPLTAQDGTVTPDASPANPQYAGSVVLSSVDLWGAGGVEGAVIRAVGDLDSDWNVYR